MLALASFVCGLIFGFGLLISGMTQPSKVLGFLDIFGRWDPTLAFVMAAALMISGIGFAVVRQRWRPVLAAQHLWPTRTDLDRPLVVGSVLFGLAGVWLDFVLVQHLSTLRALCQASCCSYLRWRRG